MRIKYKDFYLCDNSKECQEGDFFLSTFMNQAYEAQAKEQGAKIISAQEAYKLLEISEELKIIGLSGTNGKTTSAAAIYSTLLDLGYKAALVGTRGFFINDERREEKGLTTELILKILSQLKEASEAGCSYFIMEVSSHAIAQNRIDGLNFALKIFTNLSQDHLDFHKTMEEYRRVKSAFFMDESLKLINVDDGQLLYNPRSAYSYGLKENADFKILAYGLKNNIQAYGKFKGEEFEISSDLLGEFNLYNLLSAFAAVKLLTNKSNVEISKALSNFGGVAGRLELVSQNPKVIIDFAHSPDGMEKVLDTLKDNTLFVVFGAGGNRDKGKRPKMAAIAEHYAKHLIITSDNPRDEEPEAITQDIAEGLRNKAAAQIIVDRREAIKKALEEVKEDELLVILGRGDEEYQEVKGQKLPFSDKEVVKELLAKMKK